MTDRIQEMFAGRTILCDGAMGTILYARGVFINRCFDELNLSQPDLVRSVHEDYLQAGAELIETNTFGANSTGCAVWISGPGFRDQPGGRTAGATGGRQLNDKQAGKAWVAGSIGPLGIHLEPLGKTGLEEARHAFAEQIKGLAAGGPGVGVDLLVIETIVGAE